MTGTSYGVEIVSKAYTGNQSFESNTTRKHFSITPAAGSAITVEFGGGGGAIPLTPSVTFQMPVAPISKIDIVGTGSYIVQSNVDFTAGAPQGNKVGIIGTSLVNQCDYGASIVCSRSQQGWIAWWMNFDERVDCPVWYDPSVLIGWEPSAVPGATRYFQGLNMGVSGQTAQQIYDRRFDIAQMNCDIYILDMGTNDIGALTAQEIHDMRLLMVMFLETLNPRKIIALPILAREASVWPEGSTAYIKYREVNRLSSLYIESRPRVFSHDWNARWVDQDSEFGYPRANASVDGTHFDGKGAFWVGKYMAEQMSSILTSELPEQPRENTLPGDLTGTGGSASGGASGVVADDFRLELVSGDAVVVGSKDGSDNQVFVITPQGTSGQSVIRFRTDSANTAHARAGFWMQSGIDVDVEAPACVDNFLLYLRDYISGAGNVETGNGRIRSATNFTAEDFVVKMRSSYCKFDATSDTYRWRLDVTVDNTSTIPVTVTVSNAWVSQMEDPIAKYGEVVQ
jgi:lysophospholipase L1-like esterase